MINHLASPHTHLYGNTDTDTHMELTVFVLHDDCVPEEGGHGDSKTRTLLVPSDIALKESGLTTFIPLSFLHSLVAPPVDSFTWYCTGF